MTGTKWLVLSLVMVSTFLALAVFVAITYALELKKTKERLYVAQDKAFGNKIHSRVEESFSGFMDHFTISVENSFKRVAKAELTRIDADYHGKQKSVEIETLLTVAKDAVSK